MSTFDELTDHAREGWIPESYPESGFAVWNDCNPTTSTTSVKQPPNRLLSHGTPLKSE